MKSASTINERLTRVREALGKSLQDFADDLSLSRGFLANVEAGRRAVSMEVVTILVEKMSVAPDYILLGRGSVFLMETKQKPGTPENANQTANLSANLSTSSKTKGTNFLVEEENPSYLRLSNQPPRILVTTVDSVGRDNITLVRSPVAAGYAHGGFIQEEFIRQLPTFSLPSSDYRNGTFRAFTVSGDSMQPTLYAGDWVICRYVDQWAREVKDKAVHVIVTTDIPVVKRLLNRLDERGHLTLLSDNPAYPAQTLEASEVREIWVAVARLSREFTNPRFDLVDEVTRTRADLDDVIARLTNLESSRRRKP